MGCFVHIEYVATLAHAVNVCEGKFDVTFIEYVATLAHVVNVREHNFDVTLIEYVVTLACAQKNGGTNENRWKWTRSFQWRQNDKFQFGRTSQCLWQS